MDKHRRQERKRKRRARVRQDKQRAKDKTSRRGSDPRRRKPGGRKAPAVLPFLGGSVERAAEAVADMVVASIGDHHPALPDGALTGRPDDPSRLVQRTWCEARIVVRDGYEGAGHSAPTADGNPAVYAHHAVWASWARAVRDGLVSAFDLVRANLLGHRLYYLGCLDGDVADLAALEECFGYHLAAYDRESLGTTALEMLLIVGDGSRRWFFCGVPFESNEGKEGWLCSVGRVVGLMIPEWVMTYMGGEIADGDGEWHDGVAAQVVVPPLLAYHATLRTASGKSRGDLRTWELDAVSNALRSFACLAALGITAATWMDSPDGDIPALDTVAARARQRLRKFDMTGRETGWFDQVVIDERTWQGVAPSTRGWAAALPEGGWPQSVG